MLDFALEAKKTLTLIALINPVAMLPIFLSAVSEMPPEKSRRFAGTIAMTVFFALLIGGAFGMKLLSVFGVSLGAMRVGGGLIALILAIAMVIGKEMAVKGSSGMAERAGERPGIVPLAIPLLAGPAAISFMIGSSPWSSPAELAWLAIAPGIAAALVWATFWVGLRAGRQISPDTMSLVERLAGFLLASLAVEMIASGLKSLFPGLAG